MKGLPELWLIRHGETRWNREGRLQGHLDSPLTARGRRQMAALRPLGADLPAARLCSPLGRAVQSARILFGDRPLSLDPRLAEIDPGVFAGRLLADLRRDAPLAFAGRPHDWYDRTPGGESLSALSARLSALLDELTEPAIIVTHGLALAMLCALATGRPLADLHAPCQAQGALHAIRARRHRIIHPGPPQDATGQAPPPPVEDAAAGG